MFYSDDLIEEVRARNPIQDVVGQYVHLTRKGGNYFGLCPFHNEKTGSFSVSPSKQIYKCFGCNEGGNVISFIMKYEGVSFSEAMEILAKRAGIELPKQEFTLKQREEEDRKAVLLEIHKEAAIYYHKMLRSESGAPGYRYFQKRGLKNETIISFGLGYTGQHPDGLYRFLKGKGYSDAVLKDSGLVTITEKGGRDKFWNRVMFPIMDAGNRVIGFGGRVLGDGEPKYLNSPETALFDKSRTLYGLNAARKTKKNYFIICEGYMDVIAMHQAGFTNAVAALGTAFTDRHALTLRRFNVRDVILCFDSDGAGRKAILRAIPILRGEGIRMKVLSMDPYKDPDEFIKNLGAEEFQKRIDAAENAFLFEVRMEREKFDFGDPEEKAMFFNRVAKMLTVFSDEIERNSYVEAISKKYGIDYGTLKKKTEALGDGMGAPELKSGPEEIRPIRKKVGKDRDSGVHEAEKLILTELSEHPERYQEIRDTLSAKDFRGEVSGRVAELVFSQLETDGKAEPASIINHFLDDERYNEVAALFTSAYTESLSDEAGKRAFREAVKKVRAASLEEEIRGTTDAVKLMELMKKKQELK